MKRIHLFEFEDLAWFPSWLRELMTRYIVTIHKLLNSSDDVADLLERILKKSSEKHIIDFCSGSGGPMPDAVEKLASKYNFNDPSLTLTDLYPNLKIANTIKGKKGIQIEYVTTPVDVVNGNYNKKGIRTLIGSFHHMKPSAARRILLNARQSHQPICIYEISDNSFPKFLWWAIIPVNILMVFFVTPLVRPLTWKQVLFTYIIPILPVLIAWDGAVSNARTYTLKDLDKLLDGLQSKDYKWEKGIIRSRSRKLFLLGLPQ